MKSICLTQNKRIFEAIRIFLKVLTLVEIFLNILLRNEEYLHSETFLFVPGFRQSGNPETVAGN